MKLDTLVIGMDFSDAAQKGARWATQYVAPGAQTTLIHVVDRPHNPAFGRHLVPPPDVIEAQACEYAAARMRDVASFLSDAAPRYEIRLGKPYEQITALARELDADLIVIGPHGHRPRPSRFLGSTAERVVRTSSVPVLVATNPPPGPPRTLLVPVDDASITPVLLACARDLAERFDAAITLLHVWSNAIYSHVASMSYATTGSEGEARREINRELRDAGIRWLEEMARTGVQRGRVRAEVNYGDAGDVAVATAAAMKADLIVLGRRGSGLVAPALLGSTVSTVLNGAACPVLVVTDPGEAVAAI